MEYEWDESKCEANMDKHGVDFAIVQEFDWATVQVFGDVRFDYGERRYSALGLIGKRLYAIVFTRRGKFTRIISLRKANQREVTFYGQETV